MTSPSKPYRPAVRGLAFGLAALGLRAVTIGIVALLTSREVESGSGLTAFLQAWAQKLPLMNLIATLVALVGVSYSAIAAHRREWGVVLVLAWISSVVAATFDLEPFMYAAF